jgi:Icc-related predicted phosphoesterase
MKIQIISDWHQEFGFTEISFEKADLVIFAGDTHIGIRGIQWIQSHIKSRPVIYILGNHEYYRGSYPKTLNKIKELASGTNIYVLEDKSESIDGITFHGATLWTNFEMFGDPRKSGSICQEKMNDYKLIRRDPSYSKLRSIDTYIIHKATVRWLESSLAASEGGKNIVITHHAPSFRSVPEEYKNDIVSAAYASNLESLILQYQPEYWIHGHIHEPVNYEIGKTKIISNPHGYINEKYNGFNPEMIIEI